MVAYPAASLDRDETIRQNTSLDALARLRPAFREGGTVTAGNSLPLNDGAAALMLCDEEGLRTSGREPLARVRATAVTGIEPEYFGLGPVRAVRQVLERTGHTLADLATFELNEAFAAQALGCLAEWPDLDPEIVNPVAAPSPSATPSAAPAPDWQARWPTNSPPPARAWGWLPCASGRPGPGPRPGALTRGAGSSTSGWVRVCVPGPTSGACAGAR